MVDRHDGREPDPDGRIVVGLSCDYHDAAAAVVVDGRLAAAAEEERFTRVKHDRSLPEQALAACLESADISAAEVDVVVFYEKPLSVATRFLATKRRQGPRALGSFAREFPVLLRRNLMIANRIEHLLRRLGAPTPPRTMFAEHHVSHAAAAFLPSPFDTAAILCIDGVGEASTATIGRGAGHLIDLMAEQRFPNSLGLAYSLGTSWCGFRPNDGEYKLMGLAPYGEERYRDRLANVFDIGDDGSIHVDGSAVRWWGSPPARLATLTELLDGPPRGAGEPLTDRHADIARSFQSLVDDAVLGMARHAHSMTSERRLCVGGGVALNCVANRRLIADGPFDDVWIQPAAGDSGSAAGAAMWWWHEVLGHPRIVEPSRPETERVRDGMEGAALGPRVEEESALRAFASHGLRSRAIRDSQERSETVAARLADGAIVGWIEGRMEFGPRALGHRSILADARSPTVLADINRRIKGRETFRPLAPAVLWEYASEWFDIDRPSPYMLRTVAVAAAQMVPVPEEPEDFEDRTTVLRSTIPACTHVDGSARVQTVHRETDPGFHQLLDSFNRITGCPVLLNTSFNLAGEPIVCTADDATSTALRGGLDVLVIGELVVDLGTQT